MAFLWARSTEIKGSANAEGWRYQIIDIPMATPFETDLELFDLIGCLFRTLWFDWLLVNCQNGRIQCIWARKLTNHAIIINAMVLPNAVSINGYLIYFSNDVIKVSQMVTNKLLLRQSNFFYNRHFLPQSMARSSFRNIQTVRNKI